MFDILAGFVSLIQYVTIQNKAPDQLRPERCFCCGRLKPWRHSTRTRKPDRECPPGESMNPIIIQRYYCPGCKKTFSVLPECIPPRRWYLWEAQQAVLQLFVTFGYSAYAITKVSTPSYKTISRWLARFKEQFPLHKDTLSSNFNELARTSGFSAFWQACLKKMTLAAAMHFCYDAGVIIP
jgi:transposase-like protein